MKIDVSSSNQHSERQAFRLGMAIAATALALEVGGLLPGYMLSGIGVGWLLKTAVDSIYHS